MRVMQSFLLGRQECCTLKPCSSSVASTQGSARCSQRQILPPSHSIFSGAAPGGNVPPCSRNTRYTLSLASTVAFFTCYYGRHRRCILIQARRGWLESGLRVRRPQESIRRILSGIARPHRCSGLEERRVLREKRVG